MNSSGVVCPKLEELILESPDEALDVKSVVGMTAWRAWKGKKLRTIRIVDGRGEPDPKVMSELKKHVSHVDYVFELVRSTVSSDGEE